MNRIQVEDVVRENVARAFQTATAANLEVMVQAIMEAVDLYDNNRWVSPKVIVPPCDVPLLGMGTRLSDQGTRDIVVLGAFMEEGKWVSATNVCDGGIFLYHPLPAMLTRQAIAARTRQ